ncbi:conserved protein of unknown function [Tepidanaerobacter acetatoxydans Re1]|uniref:Uncharacterized protein n=1 Tax=Tepidanaerobacter acetatoxydans (strain DSM 21804 / JCM 16047 / Re1) TaxID=1209989 RepID=F4LRB6_TEPAE|nr:MULTISPECIES: hypothetical protein [Tepidanaerobacter]AEE92252.1 hypothetical protein TepRe1_2129 [Tepidanaerobacter acetatoxydans Re1]CCP27125.1 conserved protein of unknown function [Tepidanaerobacter acetatoxydans Re1]
MDTYAIPIVNGVLPRPDGGVLQGVFLDSFFANMLVKTGVGNDIFLFPLSSDDKSLYPVGVLVRIEDMWVDKVPQGSDATALFARVIGRERCKARKFSLSNEGLFALDIEKIDIYELRSLGYPIICGAGWHPTGGYTTFGSNRKDIEITIYGFELETGKDVAIVGYLGSEIEPEKAHTVEHAIIRSLKNYAMCTPKTLRECMEKETEELKWSVEIGIAKKLPEVFGVTKSGFCGNPLTQMASYYLSEEFQNQIESGEDILNSLSKARKKTVSRLTKDMDISSRKGLRQLQALKKGMFHDDTPEELKVLKRVIMKFPANPWN